MRYFTLAVLLVIATSIGVIVGVLLVRPSDTTLAVTTQQREDQIVFTDGGGASTEGDFWSINMSGQADVLAFDPNDYPPGATVRFEVQVFHTSNWALPQECVRIFDVTADAPVSGSELCLAGADPPGLLRPPVRMRSGPVVMAAGEHEYRLDYKGELAVRDTRIIVEWEEELVMNGGPPAVGGIVELRDDPNAQRDQPASGSSLPLPASVAVGLLVMGAGGLYVVRMRRD